MSKKIVFMGTPSLSGQVLKSIYQNGYEIEVVYTQPPISSHRGQKVNKSPVHIISEILNLPVRTPISLDSEDEKNFLKNKNISLGIVVAYGQILKKDFLNIAKYGWINVHYSLIPKYRGAAPIQRAIMNNESSTGISIMRMVEKLDSGPICNQYKIDILDNENSEELSNRLSTLASEKIIENIDDIFEGKAIFKEQDHSKSTYAKKIEKNEGKIDWEESAETVIGKINGLYPNPGAWFMFNGERYKILKAKISQANGKAGMVLSQNLEIACGKNAIKIIEIQRQGKRPQKSKEFLLGSLIKKNICLKDA
tara:strand:- start:358 stop:1284 length:927 start_codon:yes stop_codon:yes gene_type:complete